MKIRILEYKFHKGDNIKVQSHNKRKGKWIKNPKFNWHERVASGMTMLQGGIISKKDYEVEMQ
jgi:hypothetical protein